MRETVFSIDFEDWHQGIELSPNRWGEFDDRIGVGAARLLALLSSHKVQATFSVVEVVAERDSLRTLSTQQLTRWAIA